MVKTFGPALRRWFIENLFAIRVSGHRVCDTYRPNTQTEWKTPKGNLHLMGGICDLWMTRCTRYHLNLDRIGQYRIKSVMVVDSMHFNSMESSKCWIQSINESIELPDIDQLVADISHLVFFLYFRCNNFEFKNVWCHRNDGLSFRHWNWRIFDA